MKSNNYYKLGMSVLDTIAQEHKLFEQNRAPVSEFIARLAEQHLGILAKYEPYKALDTIFVDEVAKFYKESMGIDTELSQKIFNMYPELLPSSGNEKPDNCLIIYPSFSYAKIDGMIAHLPSVRGFILNGDSPTLVDIDYDKLEKSGYANANALSSNLIMDIIQAITTKVTDIWSDGYKIDSSEKELIEKEILGLVLFENSEACRDEIITYLVSEGFESLQRLLN